MNPRIKLILTGAIAFIAGGVLVFFIARHGNKNGGSESDEGATITAVQVKHGPEGETIVVLDADTQKRIGLVVTNPIAAQRAPEVKGYGHVIDPATLAAAIGDLETARTAADASNKEYDRLKLLAEQNNVSAKNLEAAKAAATHDDLAYTAARAKFITAWGKRIADSPAETLKALTDGETLLFQLQLPAGKVTGLPQKARIFSLNDGQIFDGAEFYDAGIGIDPQTQMQSFLFKGTGAALKPGAAVEGFISSGDAAVDGVEVPASAVLRHDGKAWIYVQAGDNGFMRREIGDPDVVGDRFARDLAATNGVVVVGAQTILSAELSSGGFNTGERD